MFSGIIEEFATVVAIKRDRENLDFTLTCSFVDELSIDQSVEFLYVFCKTAFIRLLAPLFPERYKSA